MSEANIMRACMLALSRVGSIVWRNNVAQGVVGAPIYWVKRPERIAVGPGDAVVRNARVLHAGLCDGSSDLIGLTPLVITQEMVGKTVAVFTAPEIKVRGGRRRPDQVRFGEMVRSHGGIAGFVHSPEEAVDLVKRGISGE